MKILEKLKPSNIKQKILEYRRVVEVARKPTKEEYLSSIKITAIGISLLGVIGFIIFIIYHLIV